MRTEGRLAEIDMAEQLLRQLAGPATVYCGRGQLAPQLVRWQTAPVGRPPAFEGAAVDALNGQVLV